MLSPVRPSVCLSVTRLDQSKTVEVRIMQLSPLNSPMTLVSSWLTSPRNSKGNIGSGPSGAPNKRGVGKIRNFQPISSRRISETVQDRTIVTINDYNRKSYMPFRLVPKSITLNCYKFKFSRNFALVCVFGINHG